MKRCPLWGGVWEAVGSVAALPSRALRAPNTTGRASPGFARTRSNDRRVRPRFGRIRPEPFPTWPMSARHFSVGPISIEPCPSSVEFDPNLTPHRPKFGRCRAKFAAPEKYPQTPCRLLEGSANKPRPSCDMSTRLAALFAKHVSKHEQQKTSTDTKERTTTDEMLKQPRTLQRRLCIVVGLSASISAPQCWKHPR